MSRRDVGALVVLAVSLFVVILGCALTGGVLREYGDVCGKTPAIEQVWLSGAGLGPLVAAVAVVLAIVVSTMAQRRGIRVAAAGLVVLAAVGATAGGAAGLAGKRAAWEDKPATYGSCGGYNSQRAAPPIPTAGNGRGQVGPAEWRTSQTPARSPGPEFL